MPVEYVEGPSPYLRESRFWEETLKHEVQECVHWNGMDLLQHNLCKGVDRHGLPVVYYVKAAPRGYLRKIVKLYREDAEALMNALKQLLEG